jgi:hypothetical protein
LLDDDWDEAGNDVLMVHGKSGSLIWVAPTSGRNRQGSSREWKRAARANAAALPPSAALAGRLYIFTDARA